MLAPEHPFEESFRQGQIPNRSAFGQGMCQKEMMVARGRRWRIRRGRQREVVVLHEHDGILGIDLGADGVGELLVHLADSARQSSIRNDRAGVRDVAERPEPFVGKSVVVAALLFRRQPDPPEQSTTLRLEGRRPARPGRPSSRSAEPLPWATQTPEQARITGSSAVTRPLAGCRTRDAAVRRALVDVGLAVGDDHHALSLQDPTQGSFESRRRPGPVGPLDVLLERQPIDQVTDVLEERLELRSMTVPAEQLAQLVAPAPPGEARSRQGDHRRRHREHCKGPEQERSSGLFPLHHVTHVVQEDHESEGYRLVRHGQGTQVYGALGIVHVRVPLPHRAIDEHLIGDRSSRGIVTSGNSGGRHQEPAIRRTGRGRNDAVVVRDVRKKILKGGPLTLVPVIDQRAPTARDRQLRSQLDVLVEPGPGRRVHDL